MSDGDLDDLFKLTKLYLGSYRIETIFDVGANIGDFTISAIGTFPDARIFSFEPVSSSFSTLSSRARAFGNINCVQCALGANQGEAVISADHNSPMNRIQTISGVGNKVQTQRGDVFCSTHNITRIDLLKIDTEGYDLNVLRGFSSMIESQAIQIIEVEAGMSRLNKHHVPLEAIK